MNKSKILIPVSYKIDINRLPHIWFNCDDEKYLIRYLENLANDCREESMNIIPLLNDNLDDKKTIKKYRDLVDGYKEQKDTVLVVYSNRFNSNLLRILELGKCCNIYIILGSTKKEIKRYDGFFTTKITLESESEGVENER